MAKKSGTSRSRKSGPKIAREVIDTIDVSVDDLIYPHHADILLRLDCLRAYDEGGIGQALSTLYPRFMSDVSRGAGYREGEAATHRFIELYCKVKKNNLEVKPIDVVDRGPQHRTYLPPERTLSTMRVPYRYSVLDGGHRIAIAKHLGQETIQAHVLKDQHRIVPDFTTWMEENGYRSLAFFKRYMPEYPTPMVCLSSLRPVRNRLWDMYHQNPPGTIGHGEFYTDCDLIGVCGQRWTERRLERYQFDNWISHDDRVLEIGSNTGFISIELARYANSVTTVEPDPTCYRVATSLVSELDLSHRVRCFNMRLEDHNEWRGRTERFDTVVALAIHDWTSYSFQEYINTLKLMIRPKGMLLIESHNINKNDKDWHKKRRMISESGFTLMEQVDVDDDPSIPRVACWFFRED